MQNPIIISGQKILGMTEEEHRQVAREIYRRLILPRLQEQKGGGISVRDGGKIREIYP